MFISRERERVGLYKSHRSIKNLTFIIFLLEHSAFILNTKTMQTFATEKLEKSLLVNNKGKWDITQLNAQIIL